MKRQRPYPPHPVFKRPRRSFGEWLLLTVGWIVVFCGVWLIVHWLRTAEPAGELFCTHPPGTVPLTKWGTCRKE